MKNLQAPRPNPNWETAPIIPTAVYDVSTIIVDSDNEPLEGVTAVSVSDPNQWATSDENGNIFLQGVLWNDSVKFIYQGSEKIYAVNEVPQFVDFTVELDTVIITVPREEKSYVNPLIWGAGLLAGAYLLFKSKPKKVKI